MKAVVLDTSPLSLLSSPRRSEEVIAIERWAERLLASGIKLYVPSVADFEVRRELIRLGRTSSLDGLDVFNHAVSERLLSISDSTLRIAAGMWANARNAGTPTGDPKELDCDVLIAAQALSLDLPVGDWVVATSNV